MTRKRRRMMVALVAVLGLGTATALALAALDDTLSFFYSPADVMAAGLGPDRAFRLGGLVEDDSVAYSEDGRTVHFRVTDGAASLAVSYTGIVPDLFREGQGVVAEGKLTPAGDFIASTLLARHDENYMPAEVADALDRHGDGVHATDSLIEAER